MKHSRVHYGRGADTLYTMQFFFIGISEDNSNEQDFVWKEATKRWIHKSRTCVKGHHRTELQLYAQLWHSLPLNLLHSSYSHFPSLSLKDIHTHTQLHARTRTHRHIFLSFTSHTLLSFQKSLLRSHCSFHLHPFIVFYPLSVRSISVYGSEIMRSVSYLQCTLFFFFFFKLFLSRGMVWDFLRSFVIPSPCVLAAFHLSLLEALLSLVFCPDPFSSVPLLFRLVVGIRIASPSALALLLVFNIRIASADDL